MDQVCRFLFNAEAQAETLFQGVVDDYTAIAALATAVASRPTVFLSSVYDGTWWMPGG